MTLRSGKKKKAHIIGFWKSLIIVRMILINSVMVFLADEYEQTEQKLEAKVYRTLQLQVDWC